MHIQGHTGRQGSAEDMGERTKAEAELWTDGGREQTIQGKCCLETNNETSNLETNYSVESCDD